MSLAFAFNIEEIEADPSLIDGATKVCMSCDPDNPRAVCRETCESCGGTGRQKLAAVEIAEELKASRVPQNDGGGDGGENDLFLEY